MIIQVVAPIFIEQANQSKVDLYEEGFPIIELKRPLNLDLYILLFFLSKMNL